MYIIYIEKVHYYTKSIQVNFHIVWYYFIINLHILIIPFTNFCK